jgi:hypothetical protein
MYPNRLTFAALAAACIVAAGVGGYVASRQDAVPEPAAAATAAPIGSAEAARDIPVEETEAIVEAPPAPAAPERGSADAARATTSRRTEPTGSSAPRASRATPPAPRRNQPAGGRAEAASTAPAASAPVAQSTEAGVDGNAVLTASAADQAPLETPPAEPPAKVFREIVVSRNAVIGLQTENRVSSETARVEDRIEARVTRDVRVGDVIAIPAGSRAVGSVTQVERGGKFKERARLGIRFTTLVLADGTRMEIETDTIYREGEAPGNSSAAKIGGGAVGGAILGAILGGAKGAAIGATAGAGGGAAVVQAGDRSEVMLPAGSPLTVRLVTPLTVTVEEQQ